MIESNQNALQLVSVYELICLSTGTLFSGWKGSYWKGARACYAQSPEYNPHREGVGGDRQTEMQRHRDTQKILPRMNLKYMLLMRESHLNNLHVIRLQFRAIWKHRSLEAVKRSVVTWSLQERRQGGLNRLTSGDYLQVVRLSLWDIVAKHLWH